MISRFFNKSIVVKKLPTTGHVRKYTATATVDGAIQDDGRSSELLQADVGERYIGYFDVNDPITEGRKLIESNGTEYMVDSARVESNPITGTEYLEVLMFKDSSKQDGGSNR